MKKKPAQPSVVVNRRARYDFELSEDLVVGMVLTGPETRAARDNHVQLRGAYVAITNSELWLHNASFSLKINQKGEGSRSIDTTPRKLLAHKKQIEALVSQKKSGMSIVPTKLLPSGKHIKLVIALGKGKKNWDKRETIKRRDIERDSRNLR